MGIKPIKTQSDYRKALKTIETLMLAEARSPEGEQLDVTVTLVQTYEAKHFPLDLPHQISDGAERADAQSPRT